MTEAAGPDATLETGTFASVNEERVLKRSDEGRMLTGVCAGLGRYTGMDPVIFRVGFAALVVGSGIGIMLYIAAFLLMRNTNGGPGYVEQWSRRIFDTETVMALLAAIFALGLIINLAADGISTSTVVVATLLAIALLAAHSRGVDLLAVARTLPERVRGRRGTHPVPEHWPWPPGMAPGGFGGDAAPASAAMPATSAPTGAGAVQERIAGTSQDHNADAAQSHIADPSQGHIADAPQGHTTDVSQEQVTRASQEHVEDAVPGSAQEPGAAGPPTPADSAGAPEYRRLADLARDARAASSGPPGRTPMGSPPTGPGRPSPVSPRYGPVRPASAGFDSSGEPFAPHGPYSRYAPARAYEPHDWGYNRGGAGPISPVRPKRSKSYTGVITMLIAFLVGGIMFVSQSPSSVSGTSNLPLIGGIVLIIIGAGLLIATWFGRGAGLVAAGTIMSLLLVAGSMMNGIPRKIGSYTWKPVDSSQSVRTYSVGIGDGTLDLRGTKLAPGSRTRFDATVSVGELKVCVPRTARVEVFGYTRLGDVKIDNIVHGGTDIHHNKVLEPDFTPSGAVTVIELHVKAGIGDVEVQRVA